MFEGDLSELDTGTLLSVGAEFRAAEDHAAVRQLEVALAFADRHPDPRGDTDTGFDTGHGAGYGEDLAGGERGRVYGGSGCPAVAEFAVAEFGAVFGWSSGTAEAFIGEALALRHRLPRIWAKVLAGEAVPWRARYVARMCRALSQDAAAIVDKRVVGIVNTVGWGRLKTILKAAILEADPDGAKAAGEAAARERGVFVGESDEHGTKTIWVKAAAGDVIRFDATIDDLARALRVLGDTDSLDLRRAKAVGWIADPASAHRLLEAARLLAATRRHTTDHTSTDDASTDGANTDRESTDRESTERESADRASAEGASADGAGTTGTDRGGREDSGDRTGGAGGRGREDTGAGADAADAASTASTDPAVPRPSQPRPSEPGRPGTHDRENGQDDAGGESGASDGESGGENEGGEEPAGDAAERVGDPTAHSPADLAADVAADWAKGWPEGRVPTEEPDPDDEADRDTPHPSGSDHLDYLDTLDTADLLKAMAILAWRHGPRHNEADTDPDAGPGAGASPGVDPDPDAGAGAGVGAETGAGVDSGAGAGAGPRAGAGADAPDPFSRQALAGKLAAIRQAAYSHGLGAGAGRGRGGSILYLHLTDKTLTTSEGIIRVEGAGPFPAAQLAELVGHDQIIVKPVIDLNDRVSVDSYEIPDRIRERVKLMDPIDRFPFGTAETTFGTDLDHIEPYRSTGPTGQTNTDNLAPESRFHHRVKTVARWKVRRLPGRALEWTSPHGFKWRVDPTGTYRIDHQPCDDGA